MKKRIINYRLKIDNLVANPDKISKEEWKKILQEHLTQIAFFQHERLVHLIVTVTFAILTMMSIIASIMISNPMLLVLTLLFLVLLCRISCTTIHWKMKCRRCIPSMMRF